MRHDVAPHIESGAFHSKSLDNSAMQTHLLNTSQPLESAANRNLRRIFVLRSVMLLFLGAIALSLYLLKIPMHFYNISLSLGALVLLNGYTWWRMQSAKEVSSLELVTQLVADIAILTILFYFTGGYSNPFVWMYLLPIAVGAVALNRTHTWLLAAIAMVCYSVLVFVHVPLSHLHVHAVAGTSLDIHLVGMWIGFVASASIIAFFVTRIGQNLRDYDHMIADARETALESERMMALGTLAASAAHELGTPLSTMAVISKELQLQFEQNPQTLAQLQLLSAQIHRCKDILSSLSASSGNARAQSGQSMSLAKFIETSIARWRDTRPATSLTTQLSPLKEVTIFADRTLTQALQNILDNAADASPQAINLSASWDDKTLHLAVRDYGKGLTEEVSQKIGTPFFSTKPQQGMGLGVYLTRAVLARYNGHLSLTNHPEGGVIAEMTLPLLQLITAPTQPSLEK